MARPHRALVALAAGRAPTGVPTTDDGLLASAVDHGMHGLLWSWVRDHEPMYSERLRLAGFDVATRQRHLRLCEVFTRVRTTLSAIDVDVAMLKGVAAEARWYDRTGERPCEDVDVLVEPAALHRAAEIVDALEPEHPLRNEITDLARRGVMQSVNLRVDGVSVDLHFDLLKLGFPMRRRDWVWERMQGVTLADGSTVRGPGAEVSLVHFLVHANKDSFPRLLGYADVARALATESLDWAIVERFVRAEGLEPISACALATVTGALDLPPAPLRAGTGPRTSVWRAVWPEPVTLLGSAGAARSRRQELIPFLVHGRLVDALRGLWLVAFPPAASVALQYPDLRGPYLWRLARGRAHTWRARQGALRSRDAPPLPASSTDRDPFVTARLMRTRAEAAPFWLDVSGTSMGWSIPSGTRVRVDATASPRRGEVWAFCNDTGDIVVHRFRRATGGGLRFQGDARVRADDSVEDAQLIGRVVELAPRAHHDVGARSPAQCNGFRRVAIARTVRVARRVAAGGHR